MQYKTIKQLKAALLAAGFTNVHYSKAVLMNKAPPGAPYRCFTVCARLMLPEHSTGIQAEERLALEVSKLTEAGFSIWLEDYDWTHKPREVSMGFKAHVLRGDPPRVLVMITTDGPPVDEV